MEPENTFHLKKKPPSAIRLPPPVEKTVINPSPEAPGVRAGTPVGQASWGVAFSFPCQEFTITLKNKKKSRAESLKSQRHPALEDKFDHCIT